MANYADRRVWMMTAAEAKLDEIRKEQATVDRTNKIYRQANKSIQERVQALYDELATQDDQNAWRFEGLNTPATLKSATALRKKIESAGLTDYVPERLQRRLSVYEVMELDNWYTMTKAGQDAHSTLKSALESKIKDQGEIWQRALGAGGAGFVGFDRNQVGYMLGENWYSGNFSSRLWDETQANWGKVQEEIAKALASGQDPQVTRRKIAQILVGAHQDGVKGSGGLQYDVERIIRTEMARAATQADIIKWQNEGVDEVQWNARLEANTCEHCKERDGRVYKIKQARDSVPLHPNCRCFLTPYDRVAEAARGDQTRQRQYKDENGNYELIDWAPISALTKTEDGWKAAKVSTYFFQASPWTTYEPPKTTLKFTGEINEGYTELASRAIQDAINQYPEIGYELKNSYGNTIYEHRGMSATVGNGVDMIGGVVFPSSGNQVGVALAYPSTLSGTAKAIREKMAEIAAKQYAQGYWSTDKVQHTIIHEMGHVLENYIRKRAERKPGESIQDAGDRAILEILESATGAKGKKNVLQGLTGISRYGSKNISEGFAELFARSMAQDTNLNSKTVAQFVSKLNQVREELPQKARTTGTNLVSKAQMAAGQKSQVPSGVNIAPEIKTTGKRTDAFIKEMDDMYDDEFSKDVKATLQEFKDLGVDIKKVTFSTEERELTPGERKQLGTDPDLLGKALFKKNKEAKIYLDGYELSGNYGMGLLNSKYDATKTTQVKFTENTAIGTIRHELGHIAAQSLIYKKIKETNAYVNGFDANQRYQKLLEKILGKGTRAGNLKLSEYGKTSAGEAIAESLSNPDFSSDTRKIYDYIKSQAKK